MDETGRLIEAGAHPAAPRRVVTSKQAAAGPAPRGGPAQPQGAAAAGSSAEPPLAPGRLGADPLRQMRTRDLVAELARKSSLLVRKEIELARAEIKADVRAEVRMASGLGFAGLCGIFTVQLLLVAIVFALMEGGVLPGWAASLVVAAVVLAVGTAIGLWGWARRVKKPLETTRRSLQEDVRWAKERIA